MPQYLTEKTKTGDFNPQRTLSDLFFVISERLASSRSVVLAFTANKQTNILHNVFLRGSKFKPRTSGQVLLLEGLKVSQGAASNEHCQVFKQSPAEAPKYLTNNDTCMEAVQ